MKTDEASKAVENKKYYINGSYIRPVYHRI